MKRASEIGKRNSLNDAKAIQEMHDIACTLGAECHGLGKLMGVESVRYNGIDFHPPESVQHTTLRGMAQHRRINRGKPLPEISKKITSGKPLTPNDVTQMVLFFRENAANTNTNTMLRGGTVGYAWALGINRQMENIDIAAEKILNHIRGFDAQA